MLKMDLEYDKGIFLVRLSGSLTRKYCYKINNFLVPLLKKHQLKFVIINCEELNNLDTAGTNAILHAKCVVKRNKGKIYLCNVNAFLFKQFKQLHLPKYPDEKTIISLIRSNARWKY